MTQGEKKWFWMGNGHRLGPTETSRLKSSAIDGSLRRDTLVWASGQADWLPADQTELVSLFDDVELPPPLPHERPKQEDSGPLEMRDAPAAPPTMNLADLSLGEKRWFIITPTGHHQGPLKTEHLHWSIKFGNLRRDSRVRAVGQDEWVPAESTELRSLFNVPELLPTKARNADNADFRDDLLAGYSGQIGRDDTSPSSHPSGSDRSGPELIAERRNTRIGAVVVMIALVACIGLSTAAFFNPEAFPGAKIRGPIIWVILVPFSAVVTAIAIALWKGSSLKGAAPHPTNQLPVSAPSQKRRIPKALFWVAAIIIVGVPLSLIGQQMQKSKTAAAVDACHFRFIGMGVRDIDDYDWERGYIRNVYNETNVPAPTRVDGEPIRCILIPKIGTAASYDDCGIVGRQPENHLACRMWYDPKQDIWVNQ